MARKEKKDHLVALPKMRFDLPKNCDLKPPSMKEFVEAIDKVSRQIILNTAVPKPKTKDFVRELISTKIVEPKKST